MLIKNENKLQAITSGDIIECKNDYVIIDKIEILKNDNNIILTSVVYRVQDKIEIVNNFGLEICRNSIDDFFDYLYFLDK